MSSRNLALAGALALALSLTAAVAAQTIPGLKPQSPAEAAALKSLTKLFNDPTTAGAAFDAAVSDFDQKFPASQYRLPVLLLAERYHRDHGDYLPLLRYGTAVLALDPHNVYTLSSLGQAIPDNVRDSDLDRDQRLSQASDYDHQVIGIASAFVITSSGLDYEGMHYPPQLAQTLRNNLEGPAYISLGRIAMLDGKYPEAMADFQQALPFQPAPQQQAQVYYDLGTAAESAHQAPAAQAALTKAKALATGSPFLLRMVQTELDKLKAGNPE